MKAIELQSRITKKEADIVKIQKRIDKWEANKTSEKFLINEYGFYRDFESNKDYYKQRVLENCTKELRYANEDLHEAIGILNKYKNMLILAEEKENKPVVKAFKEFVDNWKKEIKDFVEPRYQEYLEVSREYCELYNSRKGTKEQLDELDKKERLLLENGWVRQRKESGRDFDKFLDKYMEDRYYELIDKVTKVTGEITDATRLYVGYDGRINGIVIGEDGTAKLETILAGGYNIQCLHYRVLVHEYKK